jgi:hypothetical protein
VGAELTINKLPLGTVEKLIEEYDGGRLNIFAESSGKVFTPNAKQNLADITARYEALKSKATPVITLAHQLRQTLRKVKNRAR